MKERVEIFVATHKQIPADLPEGYIKAQVNCANSHEHWEGYVHDDSLDNISEKNPNYSELSVMYWAWKNSNADIKGIAHYRRFLSKINTCQYKPIIYGDLNHLELRILEEDEIVNYLKSFDVLLAMPNGPYPISAMEELKLFVYDRDIQIMEEVIKCDYPDYYAAFNDVMNSKHLNYFNMLIAKSSVFDAYCEWIFDVLGKIEKKCDLSGYDAQHSRIYGYLSEVLQNVYIKKNGLSKKNFIILQPYQMKDMDSESYKKMLKREEFFNKMRCSGLGVIEDTYYRMFHSDLYNNCRIFSNYLQAEKEQ